MVNKITTPPTTSELIGTVNGIIDEIPTVDQTYDNTSTNAQSGVAVGSAIENIATQLVAAINTKQDTLVSGTNIKTINNQSLLGSGNIDIQGGGTSVEAFTAAEVQTIWESV